VAEESPFTINVPVDLRDMHPDISGGEISCSVMDDQKSPVAGGSARFSIDPKTRSFNHTVPVITHLISGKAPQDARNYECRLTLADNSDGMRPKQPGSEAAQGDPRFEPAAGAPFSPIVNGPVPPALPSISAPAKPIKNTGAVR
jgi:hypothetical protein